MPAGWGKFIVITPLLHLCTANLTFNSFPRMAANWVAAAAKGKAAAVRVFELFDRRPPIDSKPWNEDGSSRNVVVPPVVEGQEGEIEFRNVKFAYPTRKTARVFDGFSLKIPAGQTAALIGSSGSGKRVKTFEDFNLCVR